MIQSVEGFKRKGARATMFKLWRVTDECGNVSFEISESAEEVRASFSELEPLYGLPDPYDGSVERMKIELVTSDMLTLETALNMTSSGLDSLLSGALDDLCPPIGALKQEKGEQIRVYLLATGEIAIAIESRDTDNTRVLLCRPCAGQTSILLHPDGYKRAKPAPPFDLEKQLSILKEEGELN
jgi:hypothetical protein